MTEPAARFVATPGQTIGPFFHFALPYPQDRELVPPGSPGSVRLHGIVYDGQGAGVPDALVEVRQADPTGRVPEVSGSIRREPGVFTGWGRSTTGRDGSWWFTTLPPAPVREGGAAFLAVTVFARGLLHRLFTRAYVPADDAAGRAALAADPLLASLRSDERATLLAERAEDGSLRFDIRLQGERETVFLDFPGHHAGRPAT